MPQNPIGAYATDTGTGWAAYNKHGQTWSVSTEDADTLEHDRNTRNVNAKKPASPPET